MYQSDKINELAAALCKAQSKISKAEKNSTNPFFKSKYADLDSVWTACKGPLTENGLSITQMMGFNDNGDQVLITQLNHSSGQWMRSLIPVKYECGGGDKTNPLQKLGSAYTYLRRYALAAMVGVGGEPDDDGNEGGEVYQGEQELLISRADVTFLLSEISKCDPEWAKKAMSGISTRFGSLAKMPFKYLEAFKEEMAKNRKVENA